MGAIGLPVAMELFVIHWSASDLPSYRQAVGRFVAELESRVQGEAEDGIQVIGRAHLPQSCSGITLCEAQDLAGLQAHLGPWMARYGFTYSVDIALRDAQLVAFFDSVKHLR